MCLVSICPKGTEKYNDKVISFIKSGFSSNKDGSGFMFKRNNENKITINKGFFNDVDSLLEAIEKAKLQIDDELIIHHRIGTSGKISQENCHPFVLSNKHSECCATDITINKPCLVHNGFIGKIDNYMALDRDFSDTYAFCRYVMSNKNLQQIFDEDEELFKDLVDHMIGYSRIAILYPDKDLKTIGNFITDDGYLHSNTGYKSYTYDRGGSSFLGGSSYWDRNKHRGMFDDGFSSEESFEQTSPIVIDTYTEKHKTKKGKTAAEKEATKRLVRGAILSRYYENSTKSHKKIDMVPINLRFDGSTIEITKYNFTHFHLILKDTYELQLASGKLELYSLEEFDLECDFQTVKFVESNTSSTQGLYEAVLNEDIRNNYYYHPKLHYYPSYKQFKDLITSIPNPGKQCLKKLNKLLNSNAGLDNDSEIYYSKTNIFQIKRALILFRDLIKKELEYKDSLKMNVTQENPFNPIMTALN